MDGPFCLQKLSPEVKRCLLRGKDCFPLKVVV